MKAVLTAGVMLFAAHGHASEVAVTEISLKDFPTLPNKTRKESAEIIGEAIRTVFSKKLLAMGHHLVDKDQTAPNSFKLELKKFRQTNRTPAEVLNAPNKPASETVVTLSMTLMKTSGNQTWQKLEGKFGGQFFGTTDRWELSGNPEDKALMINLVGKKRAEAIAMAMWNSVERAIRDLPLT